MGSFDYFSFQAHSVHHGKAMRHKGSRPVLDRRRSIGTDRGLQDHCSANFYSWIFGRVFYNMSQGVHEVREQLAHHIFAGTEEYHILLLTGTKKELTGFGGIFVWSSKRWMDEWWDISRLDSAEVRGRGQEWDV